MRLSAALLVALGLSSAAAFTSAPPRLGLGPQRIASAVAAQRRRISATAAHSGRSPKVLPRMSLADESGGDQASASCTPFAWTKLSDCLSDHYQTASSIPSIMKGAIILSPDEVETTHLTVNSVFQCPFCTGLHGELGRMSGMEEAYELNSSDNLDKCLSLTPHEAIVRYSREFASRGAYDPGDFEQLSSSIGPSRASSVRGLAWFLKWGAFGGNTILTTPKSPSLFKLLFSLYYLPLYGIIKAFSAVLTVFPTGSPKVVSQAIGLMLPVIAGVWVVPVGVLGGVARLLGLLKK